MAIIVRGIPSAATSFIPENALEPGNPPGATQNTLRKAETGFDINKFTSQVLNKGLLKNNLYLVYFSRGFDEDIKFYTSNVRIPAADLATIDIRRYGYGPIERFPYRPLFAGDVDMDFYTEASNKGVVQTMFNKLSNSSNFMNYNDFAIDSFKTDPSIGTESENTGLPTVASVPAPEPYQMEYKDNIKFDIEVYLYNENSDKIITYKFKDCFVRMVGSIGLSWESNDTLIKYSVGFAYTDFSVNVVDANSGEGITSLSSIQRNLSFNTLSQTLSAIKNPVNTLTSFVNNPFNTLRSIF